jgi:hypothetical protein
MNKATICIISHQHLCRNPRVLKESLALKKIGYKVIILTAIYSEKLLLEDLNLLTGHPIEYKFYSDLRIKNFSNYIIRAKNKIGRYLNVIGFENIFALGYAPDKCLSMAINTDADLFICHQELPTYIGTVLLEKGKKVAFDIEDWYTEDLLPAAQKYRPQSILKASEQKALTHGNATVCTSKPMAAELSVFYHSRQPHVIYNSFTNFSVEQIEKPITNRIKMIWISQTIGPGRGLEELVSSLNEVYKIAIELNLRGNISEEYRYHLNTKLVNKDHEIKYLPLLPNSKIQQDLLNFDIGLASEPNSPKNKDLTISNKIFHYLSVGLPVLASATKGQLSLKEDFRDGIQYYHNTAELSEIFSSLDKTHLQNERAKILRSYREKYDWTIMEYQLQNIVKEILP